MHRFQCPFWYALLMVQIAHAILIAGGCKSIICGAWNAPYENKDVAKVKFTEGFWDGLSA
jgi:hypothetical protein